MIERDKQVDDQQKKQAKHKEDEREHEQKVHEARTQEQQQAGMATDPETMKDKGYVKRIEEKTEKH